MDKRRNMVVAVAVLLALVAGFAAFLFLKDSDESKSKADAQTDVVVAVRSIASNTKAAQLVSQGAVKVESRPANAVPVDAIRSVDELTGAAYADLVLVQDVPATTTMTRSLFTNPGAKGASFNSALAIDEQLITVPGDRLRSLTAGLLKPGDRVNMIISSNAYEGAVAEAAEVAATPAADGTVPAAPAVTAYMLQNVEVYAVGATTALPPSAAEAAAATVTVVTSSDITFRTNSVQALQIVRAVHEGASPQEIWLTLMAQDFGKAQTVAVANRNLLTSDFVKGGSVAPPPPAVVEKAAKTTTTTTSSAAKPADEK